MRFLWQEKALVIRTAMEKAVEEGWKKIMVEWDAKLVIDKIVNIDLLDAIL